MANNNQDVTLRIRAENLSKKTTDQVVSSLEALAKAQDKQIEGAKRGATTAAQLEAGYKKIESAAQALISQGGLIKLFQSQSEASEQSRIRMEAARTALTSYTNSLDPAVRRTAIQNAEMKSLSKALAGAEKSYGAIEARLANTGKRLAQVGIDTNNLVAAQSKINSAVTGANTALERQEAALAGLETRQRRLKAVEDARASRENQIRLDNAFTQAQDAAAAALLREAAAQREANLAAQTANRQRQVQVDVAFANAQRDAAEAINKKTAALNAQNIALRAAADAAERQMRSSITRTGPVTNVSNLAGTVQDIANPAAAALRSVSGLESAVASLEQRLSSVNGPVRNYRDAMREAAAAQQALQTLAGRVDAYNRQIVALRASRAEYVAARAAVNALITEMRSGAAGADVTTRLAQAQSTLAGAAAGFNNLSQAARTNRDALRAAGVNTNDMANAEQRLTDQARRGAAAINGLTQAVNQHGEATNRATTAMGGWLTGGRNTMSLASRIKGELLGMAASYIGLQGAIGVAGGALDTYNRFQALNSRLLVSTAGDQKAAAAELEYLTKASDRFGFVLLDIGNAYAKFSIAAKTAGFNTQETRYVFEQFAKAAQNARLSTQEFDGILKAVEQMMSKGSVQAEELRGQLGDRLPGAFAIAAKAAGKTTAEYSKMLELGQVSSDEVLSIARGVGETYGAIGKSGETLNQAQARFQNASNDFKQAIAENGFVDAYMEFLKKLTVVISGENGNELAGQLASAFKSVLDILILLIENLDSIKLAFQVLLGLKIASWAFGAAGAIKGLWLAFRLLNAEMYAAAGTGIVRFLAAIGVGGTAAAGGIGAATAAFGLLRTAITLLLRAIPYVGIALAAISVIKFAWDKFFNKDDAVKAGRAAGKAGAEAAAGAAGETPAPPPRDKSYDIYSKSLSERQTQEEKLERERLEILRQGNKKNLAERLKYVDQTYDADRREAQARITDKTALELRLADIQALSLKDQANERMRYANEQVSTEESTAKKRERLALEIAAKLKEIEDDIAKRRAEADKTQPFEDRREARVKAIGHAYDDLGKKIIAQKQLDAPAANLARQQLDALTKERQEMERVTATREEALDLQKRFNSLQEIQAAQIDAINTRYESGQITAAAQLEEINRVVSESGPALEEAGNKALVFAQSVRQMLDPVVYQRLLADIGKGIAKANVDAVTSTNNLNATQAQLNALLAQQKNEIDMITLQRKLGMISSDEEAAKLNANATSYKDRVLELLDVMRQQLDIAREFGAVSEEAYNKAKAGIDEMEVKTKNAVEATSGLTDTIVGGLADAGTKAFESLGDSLGKMIMGTESLKDGFKNAAQAAGQFFAQLLRDIALAIAKQLILNAIASYGGGIGAGAVKLGGVIAGQHNGGVTGTNATFHRRIPDMSVFTNAARYHTGGIAGFAPNEVPAVLERNEEVLTRDDPRHVLNGGASGGGGNAGTRVVVVDERSSVAEAMQSAEGERVIMHWIKRNSSTIKQWTK